MGLKSGLYIMGFLQYEDDENDDFDDEKYTTCLGAVHVGEIPDQFRQSYFKALLERFDTRYTGEKRPIRIDFHYRDPSDSPLGGGDTTEKELMDWVLKYDTMSPDHREVLDLAVSIAKSMERVIVPVSTPITTPTREKKKRKKITDAQYHKAIRLVLGDGMHQSEAEIKCGLWVGALSKGKGEKMLDEATKEIADASRRLVPDEVGKDYLHNEVRHKKEK
jgi:hypothetical protein